MGIFKKRYTEIPDQSLDKILKDLGFDENESYDIPETIDKACELSIKAHVEMCKKNALSKD